MKKRFQILVLTFVSLLFIGNAFSQDKYGNSPEECKEKLSEFYEFALVDNYEFAYDSWLWCYQNCPKANRNIYVYGIKLAERRYDNGTPAQKVIEGNLIDEIYTKRIEYYPENLGRVYGDWASSLEKRAFSKEKVFEKLETGFKADPSSLGIQNIAKYFSEVTAKFKDNDAQKVFDTYDDAIEALNRKIDLLSKQKDSRDSKLKEGEIISIKEQNRIKTKYYEKNLMGLGQAEGILDQIIDDIATCDRLIPLYAKNLDANKNNAQWLRRAASRLNAKDCSEDPLYPKIVEAFVNADPSPEAHIFYADILEDRGETTKALAYRNKAVELETDPYKKAAYLYRIALTIRKKSVSTARSYANRALHVRPSMGKAYLLIASTYASSANSCGDDEFSKRMIFVAAANKAKKAKEVDPSLTSTANKYIKSYTAQFPTKTQVFTKGFKSGTPWKISCWINETVLIP